jgi:ABC-type transporter Mla maintaining outer membrane lipid asymmetry ATPase subunit MlaF
VLANGKVIAQGTVKEIMQVDDPWVQSYFESRKILGSAAEHHGT